jgi:hypothetical protein
MTDPRIAVLSALSSPDWHPVPEAHGMPWDEAEELLAAYDASRGAAAPSAPAERAAPAQRADQERGPAVNSRRSPAVRAPKPNEHERAQRQAAIEILLRRALHGVLSVPEAAVLADYWRAERELADKTRRSLGETTRALQRNREAADAEIRRLEARMAELEAATGTEGAQEGVGGPQGVQDAVDGARDVRGVPKATEGRSGDFGEAAA